MRKIVKDTEEQNLRIRKGKRDPAKGKGDSDYQDPLTLN